MSVKFEWYGGQVTAKMEAGAVSGLFDAGQYLLQEATKRVPHDSGLLEKSGVSSVNAAKLETEVRYGNEEECDYAAAVHESPEKTNFQRGRERKWLENTFNLYGKQAFARFIQPFKNKFK